MIDYAANLALFLVAETGTVYGRWRGKMTAKNQRILFGQYLGKGRLTIDGDVETISHSVRRCFGADYDETASLSWRKL